MADIPTTPTPVPPEGSGPVNVGLWPLNWPQFFGYPVVPLPTEADTTKEETNK